MYFLSDDTITKYDIVIDEGKLKKVKEDIITNCSTVTHVFKEDTIEPNYLNIDYIRNYRAKKIGIKDDKVLYWITYDHYEHPWVIPYINQLLYGNVYAIDKIIGYYLGEYKKIVREPLIEEKIQCKIEALRCLKDKIVSVDEIRNLNKKTVDDYFMDILDCVTFLKRKSLDKKTYDEVLDFFEIGDPVKSLDFK